jgi:P27 family predicted phage terminase small subunit
MSEKLPTETKELSGTLRPCREHEGLEAGARLSEAPLPPDTLSEGAVGEWIWLAPVLVSMKLLTEADLRTLALCCETLATATALEEAIRAEGFTIAAATGGQKAHPALKALETTRNAAVRLLSDFGLSPKARKYVQKAPTAEKDNPWSSYNLNRNETTPEEEKAADEEWNAMVEKHRAKNPDGFRPTRRIAPSTDPDKFGPL